MRRLIFDGYESIEAINPVKVDVEIAFDYALERCGLKRMDLFSEDCPEHLEAKTMIEDWYYSGEWVRVTEYEPIQKDDPIGDDGDEARTWAKRAG